MKYQKWLAASVLCAVAAAGVLTGGCGQQKAPAAQQAMKVSTFKAFTSNTPVVYEYVGTVAAEQQVPVRSRVSGTIMEKYISGGEVVTEGQPLYRIDTRQYESSLAAAQANQAQSGATYQNAMTNLSRYEQLVASDAISQQTYDNQRSMADQYRSAYDAAGAQVKIAQDNLNDTIVRAPFSGKLSMDDVNIGTYATAGNTALVTISSSDPVFIQFEMSEAEYLAMAKKNVNANTWGDNLKIRLSDGTLYSEPAKVVQVNPGMTSGQLSLKASVANPDGLLVPGMYASVVSDTEIAANSVLVPTDALIQILDKNLVDVVTSDNKVTQKPVTVAGTFGIYTVITGGLSAGDTVIVEGQGKVRAGQSVAPEELTQAQLDQKVKTRASEAK